MREEDSKNYPRQPEAPDAEALKQIILELEKLLRKDEEKLASQGGKDLEAEKADAELAAQETEARAAAAISELFECIKFDVSFDSYLRHSNADEHDRVTQQQRDLEQLQKAFLDLSQQYDPKSPDSKITAELSRLRTEIESAQGFFEQDIEKRDANRTRQGQEQSQLIDRLEQIKKTLLDNYDKVTDQDLLEDAISGWMNSSDILAATLNLRDRIKSESGLRLKKQYFENIGWVKQRDLEAFREKRSKTKPLPERIAALRGVIEKYKNQG